MAFFNIKAVFQRQKKITFLHLYIKREGRPERLKAPYLNFYALYARTIAL